MPVVLRLDDPDARFKAVRLASDLHLSHEQRSFTRNGESWKLEVELPDVQRLEYKLEVEHPDGGTEHILDPASDKRAPGAFGEKSVLELDGYEAPAWLEAEGVPGRYDDAEIRGRGLGGSVALRVWSPEDAPPGTPLRLLLANDGPEYDALAQLTRYAAATIAAGTVPPFRVALLQPGDRDNWYSASAAYSRVLDSDVLPQLRGAFGVIGAPVGMGASLGALAMLHAQRRFPRMFSGLFLQSGSYFIPRYDRHESGFSRYTRITRFVRDTLRDGEYAMPVPVTITVGKAEENASNNRDMARALAAQGYEVSLEEVLDMHNYVGWRDAFDPHLTQLLKRAWTR
ncbi:alpha/beta hydrolase-fold protein [Solirubrobacter phytolaccae]|uniref:Alpha/beta hydrolase-fold protein n=1 Tax=Solirubrobacter phytolaccae TaxID=1404360 RepID=A0A9X3N3X2_9ACTN|nr:alpha/beta hydrolase-fold protein [Solirubrobacter phytolaccae]MDA0179159.1 alpha/beta hydrolase-fold protein [Solirubrobacter phytolaccae]